MLINLVVLTGDSGVGKSTLINRFKRDLGRDEPGLTTIGIEIALHNYKDENGAATTQIWDTSGKHHYFPITPAYFRGSSGVLLIYDICDYSTFASLGKRLEKVRESTESDIPIGLVGNKSDLSHLRAVPREEGQQFAGMSSTGGLGACIASGELSFIAEHGLVFSEASKLDDSLVDAVFENLIKSLIQSGS